MSEQVIIIGAGGHAKVVEDIIKLSGDIVFGFLDDDTSKSGVLGKVSECIKYSDKSFIIAIGSNAVRKKIASLYPKLKYYTAIHPTAIIADNAEIGKGTVIMAKAVVNPCAVIGSHCIVNTAAIVEHDNIIGDYVHISPNAVLCGTVIVGDRSYIGAGSVVKNNISITDDVVIGCGGSVVKNVVESGTYVGVPVRKLY